jgi:redox-sensitive bicupin YhaK (pirin superfamily)
MIDIRPFATLGHADHGWLDARHHFSFADYHDPARMGWGSIRVWNDDEIAAKSGFPPHPHRDMEIVTYVREGAITHQDSMGNKGRTGAGDVQVMSAGTGVRHAEYNLEDEKTTLFQIWVQTDRPGAEPGWGARRFPKDDRAGSFVTLASGFQEDSEAQDQRRRPHPRSDPESGRDRRAKPRPRPPRLSRRRRRRRRGQRPPGRAPRRRGGDRRAQPHDPRDRRRRDRPRRRPLTKAPGP